MNKSTLQENSQNNLAWLVPMGFILLVVFVFVSAPQSSLAQPSVAQSLIVDDAAAADIDMDNQSTELQTEDATPLDDHYVYLPFVSRHYCGGYPCEVYRDEFDDSNSGWPREHSYYPHPDRDNVMVEVHRDYQGDTYNMEIKEEWFTDIYAMAPDVTLPDNYTVQVDMKYDFSDWNADWGLILNATGEPGACYMITVMNASGSVMYKIRRRSANGYETTLIANAPPLYALQKNSGKWNRLKVTRQGDSIHFETFSFSFNQWYDLATVYDDTLNGGGVGFRVFTYEQGSEAWFDNLIIWDLGP